MTQPGPLSLAETLFLLKPNLTTGRATIRVTLFWLISKGILGIETNDEEFKSACVFFNGRFIR